MGDDPAETPDSHAASAGTARRRGDMSWSQPHDRGGGAGTSGGRVVSMATEVPDHPLEEHEVPGIARFWFAMRRFEHGTEVITRECGLTPQRYILLLAVFSGSADGGTATVSGIRRDLQMPQSTVSEAVARAVDVGLLKKAAVVDDARVTRITLTPEGRARLAQCVRRLQRVRADLRQALIDTFAAYPD